MANDMREPDEIIQAYLRGRLSTEESAGLEQSLEQDPAQWREFERVLRTREGLAVLHARGELAKLVGPPPWYRRAPALAAAAATLAGVVVGGRWIADRLTDNEGPKLLAVPNGMAARATLLRLARTRGNLPVIARPASGLLEIRVRPEYRHARYDLALSLPGSAAVPGRTLTLRELALGADGEVTAYLVGANLPLGDYLATITPVDGSEAEASVFEFMVTD